MNVLSILADEGEVLVDHTYLKRRYPMKVKSKVQAGGKDGGLDLRMFRKS